MTFYKWVEASYEGISEMDEETKGKMWDIWYAHLV